VEAPISAGTGTFSPPVSFPDSSHPQPVQTAAPTIQQIQSTAAEAIASVSNKRTAGDDNRPYSKRRKKPRLPDCERKLAELKAENELLKRHLDNISNKSMVLEKERIAAEQKMRAMLQANAPDHELEPLVKNFAEMYSDYGRKRHEELNFHLEQLQRYVTYYPYFSERKKFHYDVMFSAQPFQL
jgi:predicted RNase H-like nuclease (RuvC/YqgF family)